jgi:flagellar protein FlaI
LKFPSITKKKKPNKQDDDWETQSAAQTGSTPPTQQNEAAGEPRTVPADLFETTPGLETEGRQTEEGGEVTPEAQTTPPLVKEGVVSGAKKTRKSAFSFRSGGKRSAAPLDEAAVVKEFKRKQSGGFMRKSRKGASATAMDAAPRDLVKLEGHKVLVPTYDDIDKYGNIIYPVREPYQFVNLHMDAGELVYTAIEPRLSSSEKEVMKRAASAFDMLVNVGTVLTSVDDKLQFLEETFREIVGIYNLKLNETQYRQVLYHIERDYVGYGKIDTLVRDRLIEDISCNGPGTPVFIYHRFFESIRTNVVFEEVELNNFILRLAQLSGRHISILQPIRDAALPDGSRINMTLGKEVTKKGSTFTIRKFRSEPISPIEIVALRTGDAKIFAYLWLLIEYGRSLLISGGTAAGKTTLLNAISMLIKPENKIVSVEDTPEINLAHPNWIQAVTRVGFGESGGQGSASASGISGIGHPGKSAGDINLFDLLIAALRQRPDFIIVGEVRGEEAYTLFQAISVGHATMGTIHAASITELLARVESQPMNVPRVMVANLDLCIFVAAVRKGEEKVRRIREIVEILGVNPATKELVTNTTFSWDPATDSYDFNGRSFIIEKISKTYGIPMDKLDAELQNRIQLLERMQREGITNYKAVTDIVRQYYLDRDSVINAKDLATVAAGDPPNDWKEGRP